MIKQLALSAGVAVAASLFVVIFFGGTSETIQTIREVSDGAAAGDTYTFPVNFLAGSTDGGVFSTTTAGTVNLPASNLAQATLISVLPTSATTLTLPASTTLGAIMPTPGMTKVVYINNRGTSTSNTLTIAGATGVVLKKATTSATMSGDTDGSSVIKLILTRLASGNFTAAMSINAD